jgi:hypothetical protein
MADRKPLWEVMREAYERHMYSQRKGYAAELRAIADEVVPEHLCEADDSWDAAAIAYGVVRDRLLAAADEAEGKT